MSNINFPQNVVDGTTFFHENNVCVFHSATDTWECTAVITETPQPVNQNIYVTTSNVSTLGDKRTEWQTKLGTSGINFVLPPVANQQEVNDAIMTLLCYIKETATTGVSQSYVDAQIAAIPTSTTTTVPADTPTRAEFNALVTTVMAAIANGLDD